MYYLNIFKKSTFLLLSISLLTACKNGSENEEQGAMIAEEQQQEQGLKDYYSDYFPMGVAVAPGTIMGESAELVKKEFNSITPENVMKMGPIHPEKDRFNWEHADAMAEFARENGLKMRGHALVWHQQTGGWIFEDEDGNKVDREELLKRMKTHIDSVVGRYKGTIYAWDVVNEAISDKPDELLRKSEWLEIIGEDFIAKAFEYARAADPDAKLYYNDYNALFPKNGTEFISC